MRADHQGESLAGWTLGDELNTPLLHHARPKQASMTSTVDLPMQEQFPEFHGRILDEETKMVSVNDIIHVMTACPRKHCARAWNAIKESHPETSNVPTHIRLNGAGQLTPALPVKTVSRLALVVPGRQARRFNDKASSDFLVREYDVNLETWETLGNRAREEEEEAQARDEHKRRSTGVDERLQIAYEQGWRCRGVRGAYPAYVRDRPHCPLLPWRGMG